jgi:hypothetical protein
MKINPRLFPACLFLCVALSSPFPSVARNPIRRDFFNLYKSSATGSVLDTVPSNADHCGVCHFNFDGGGPRNPYGAAVEANGANQAAMQAIEGIDSDGDGRSNINEITNSADSPYEPTFPGLSAGNVDQVSMVDLSDVTAYLTPSSGGPDTTPPNVTVISPNGGNTATGNAAFTISWSATDASGIAAINLYLSLDHGATYKLLAKGLPNTPNSFTWFVSNRPTQDALIKVEAIDTALNKADDVSDGAFSIISTNGFPFPTLRDFDQPGTQPIDESGLTQALPADCASCHGNYDAAHEPYRNWMGSMMAHASHDPIFKANLAIAQQDVPDSGDLCLRCHNSRGWLDGRSTPTDGSQMTGNDMFGVSCDLCHRMVDPVYVEGFSPTEDEEVLNALADVPAQPDGGNGMYVFDPNAHRRGPYTNSVSEHADLYSPFHRDSALCGTCHNVSNPAFERNGTNTEYVLNGFDAPATNFSPEILMPVERTYSEWLHSAYNTSNGVYAPQFAGNKSGHRVASCQDCHMRDIAGYGANTNIYPSTPLRQDLPLHDMTGGSSWLLKVLPTVTNFPYAAGTANAIAMTNGAEHAGYMLRKAARMSAVEIGTNLNVMVINDTGHKLPSGYPEGRRIWINVRFYDSGSNLIEEFGAYNTSNAVLTVTNTTVYEVHPGIGTNLASILEVEPGPSFHFVLNNQIYEDNRIPPRGFANSVFDTFGGAPVGHHYDDGQHWDNTLYPIPENAVSAHVRLFYQSTSKEFIEFMYEENNTTDDGEIMKDLWEANDRCPPVLMTEAWWPENFTIQSIGPVDGDTIGISFSTVSGYTYWVEYTDELDGSSGWKPFASNNWIEATGSSVIVTDDFTSATSGGAPTNNHRFYRIQR